MAGTILLNCDTSDLDVLYIIWTGNFDYQATIRYSNEYINSIYDSAIRENLRKEELNRKIAVVNSVILKINRFFSGNDIKNYIIVETQNTNAKFYNEINANLYSAFGSNFVDISGHRLDDNDGIHYTESSYAVMGVDIYNKVKSLGYDI